MLDLNTQLGRDVPTAKQVFEVLRPQMRIARALQRGIETAMREGWLAQDPDMNLTDAGDDGVERALFRALVADGIESVGGWAKDLDLVYDGTKLREFVRQAIITAGAGLTPEGGFDY